MRRNWFTAIAWSTAAALSAASAVAQQRPAPPQAASDSAASVGEHAAGSQKVAGVLATLEFSDPNGRDGHFMFWVSGGTLFPDGAFEVAVSASGAIVYPDGITQFVTIGSDAPDPDPNATIDWQVTDAYVVDDWTRVEFASASAPNTSIALMLPQTGVLLEAGDDWTEVLKQLPQAIRDTWGKRVKNAEETWREFAEWCWRFAKWACEDQGMKVQSCHVRITPAGPDCEFTCFLPEATP